MNTSAAATSLVNEISKRVATLMEQYVHMECKNELIECNFEIVNITIALSNLLIISIIFYCNLSAMFKGYYFVFYKLFN